MAGKPEFLKLIEQLQQLSLDVEQMDVEMPHVDICDISELLQRINLGEENMDLDVEVGVEKMDVEVDVEEMDIDVTMEKVDKIIAQMMRARIWMYVQLETTD